MSQSIKARTRLLNRLRRMQARSFSMKTSNLIQLRKEWAKTLKMKPSMMKRTMWLMSQTTSRTTMKTMPPILTQDPSRRHRSLLQLKSSLTLNSRTQMRMKTSSSTILIMKGRAMKILTSTILRLILRTSSRLTIRTTHLSETQTFSPVSCSIPS